MWPSQRVIVGHMTRFPSGTPYAGPTMNYDDQLDPEQLLRRIVYGMPRPLLGFRARMDDRFYGRLFDALSNSHAALVKCAPEQTCRNVAAQLRKELPPDLFSVGVLHAPEREEWMVFVYNRVRPETFRPPTRLTPDGPAWVNVKEVARVLRLSIPQARAVMVSGRVPHKRMGGRNEIMIQQKYLSALANRPRRWQRRKKTA